MTRKIKTKRAEKSAYRDYFLKAKEFLQTMQMACERKSWNSVGLEAVHCVISANDALLTFFGGIRCMAEDHRDAARLLTAVLNTENAKKNVVEYEGRLFSRLETEEVKLHAERFFDWVKSLLPPDL